MQKHTHVKFFLIKLEETYLFFIFNIKYSSLDIVNMSKLAKMNPENLFDIEFTELKTENSKLPTYLFEVIKSELTNIIIDESSPEEETDGAFELIRNIVDNVRSEIENFVENEDLKKFLYVLTKVFTLLLNIKVDNTEKIINIVKLAISSILKKWSEPN